MKEYPIIFSSEMVLAILDGRKTMTRRVIKPQPEEPCSHVEPFRGEGGGWIAGDNTGRIFRCPYGQPGDRLWVKEIWRVGAWSDRGYRIAVDYRADNFSRREWLSVPDHEMYRRLKRQSILEARRAFGICSDRYKWQPGESPCRWRSSRFMPRWASRIMLEITNIEGERLQNIKAWGALLEGLVPGPDIIYRYSNLWNSLNAKRGFGWDVSSWAWVIEFKRVEEEGK